MIYLAADFSLPRIANELSELLALSGILRLLVEDFLLLQPLAAAKDGASV